MKTEEIFKKRAEHLSQALPDGCVFTIGQAYGGYKLLFQNQSGECFSACGYEKKSVMIAQFEAVSTVLDGHYRSRCTDIAAENHLCNFRDKLEDHCESAIEEISMLSNLAHALMLEMNQDKVIRIINKVIQDGYNTGLLGENKYAD